MDSGRVYKLIIASVFLYAVNGTIDYVVIKHLQLGTAILSIGIGFALGFAIVASASKLRFSLARRRYYAFSGSSALLIAGYTALLFLAYERYTLASIYPLIGLSALVFFAIDAAKYRKKVPPRKLAMLLVGVLLVAVGVFYAESNGFSFQVGTLPFVVGISVIAGVAYYMQFYRIEKYSVGSKLALQPVFLIIIALAFQPAIAGQSLAYAALGVLGGSAFTLANFLELRAMKASMTKSISRTVVRRNLLNDLGYLDTLLVLAGSLIIGSFLPIEILGGVLIFSGIVVISRIS